MSDSSTGVSKPPTCDQCVDEHVAAWYCVQCSLNMCQKIADVHVQIRATSNHHLQPISLPFRLESSAKQPSNDQKDERSAERGQRKIPSLFYHHSSQETAAAASSSSSASPLAANRLGQSRPPLDFVYLFSSPLVTNDKDDDSRTLVMLLSQKMERAKLQNVLISSREVISARCRVATHKSISDTLSQSPTCLHFCGHGGREGSLHFEELSIDGTGAVGSSSFFSTEILHKLLQRYPQLSERTRLVVLSACHSSLAGEAFLKANVPHVVAVNYRHEILDDASRIFTLHFYEHLFSGRSVQQAFDEAIFQLSNKYQSAASTIQLLPEGADHGEILFPQNFNTSLNLDSGFSSTMSTLKRSERFFTAIEHLPNDDKEFILRARQSEMVDLLRTVFASESFRFSLHGEARVGKSSLLLAAANYIAERSDNDEFVWIPCSPNSMSGAVSYPIDVDICSDIGSLSAFVSRCCSESLISVEDEKQAGNDLEALASQMAKFEKSFPNRNVWLLFDGIDELQQSVLSQLIKRVSGKTRRTKFITTGVSKFDSQLLDVVEFRVPPLAIKCTKLLLDFKLGKDLISRIQDSPSWVQIIAATRGIPDKVFQAVRAISSIRNNLVDRKCSPAKRDALLEEIVLSMQSQSASSISSSVSDSSSSSSQTSSSISNQPTRQSNVPESMQSASASASATDSVSVKQSSTSSPIIVMPEPPMPVSLTASSSSSPPFEKFTRVPKVGDLVRLNSRVASRGPLGKQSVGFVKDIQHVRAQVVFPEIAPRPWIGNISDLSLAYNHENTSLHVGDRAQVVVDEPEAGWGPISPYSTGFIRRITPIQVHLAFPDQFPGLWGGQLRELALIQEPEINSGAEPVACNEFCDHRHSKSSICLECSNTWDAHSGHNCADGTRGKFLLPESDAIEQLKFDTERASLALIHPEGEWRDQDKLSQYCSMPDRRDGKVCTHPQLIRSSHWSCCGATSKHISFCRKSSPPDKIVEPVHPRGQWCELMCSLRANSSSDNMSCRHSGGFIFGPHWSCCGSKDADVKTCTLESQLKELEEKYAAIHPRGEWRDQDVTRQFCSFPHQPEGKICLHSSLCRDSHWSCCGSTDRNVPVCGSNAGPSKPDAPSIESMIFHDHPLFKRTLSAPVKCEACTKRSSTVWRCDRCISQVCHECVVNVIPHEVAQAESKMASSSALVPGAPPVSSLTQSSSIAGPGSTHSPSTPSVSSAGAASSVQPAPSSVPSSSNLSTGSHRLMPSTVCRICMSCGFCTGFGATCVACRQSGRRLNERGVTCGCGAGHGGCESCGLCRLCCDIRPACLSAFYFRINRQFVNAPGATVRRAQSINSDMVGVLPLGDSAFTFTHVTIDGWAKLSPIHFDLLKQSAKFVEHNPESEGWVAIRLKSNFILLACSATGVEQADSSSFEFG